MSSGTSAESETQTQPLAEEPSADPKLLVELYDSWAPFVYGLALTVTASPAAAAEITYDVFMLVWGEPDTAHLPDFAMHARLAALTHARATGLAADRQGLADREHLGLALARASLAFGTAAPLHPQQRLALALTYPTGGTIRDAARVLGLSRSAVLEQLIAAVQQLSKRPARTP